ncbi:MAG TPA: glycosyltransferase family 4 protein [candidate division Zixibacteria bacterium]|nr:glycosyltransferase family 4 protein [candidate division Zixibacteria bacterium]
MNPLKIGYFVKMYPRLSETFILNEILELERRGVEVVIFSLKKPNEGRFHPQVSGVRASVYYLDELEPKKGWSMLAENWPALSPHRSELWMLLEELVPQNDPQQIELFFASAWAAAIALKRGIEHFHAHFATLPSTLAHFAGRISGLPFSFTAHAKDIFQNTVNRKLLEEKLSAARFVITVTEFNRRFLTSTFPAIPAGKIKVLYNGINLDFFSFEPKEPREKNLILSIGRLVPKKGFPDLLEACAVLKSKHIPFQCVIIGQGEESVALETKRMELGLDDWITFAGPKTQAEVLPYLKRATLLALPCTVDADGNQDALPTVLLEALATGCPAVSTTVSGIPEIIDSGTNGLLVPPGNPPALAEAMEKILFSPELAVRFAREERKKAEAKFDLKKSVETLEGFFRQSVETETTKENTEIPAPSLAGKTV